MAVKTGLDSKLRSDLHRLTLKHFMALRNVPKKPSAAGVQQQLSEIKKELFAALDRVEPQYQKAFFAGIVKTAPTDKRLRTILKTALALSHSQGMYDGLRDGWRLHKFSLALERDVRKRLLVPYVRLHPERPSDQQICKYLDLIIKRPRPGLERDLRQIVRTIRDSPNASIERMTYFLHSEITSLKTLKEEPVPIAKWRCATWDQALHSRATRNRVSKYLSEVCQLARGRDCGFLEAWEELREGKSQRKSRTSRQAVC
jgi:hypothetical protein